MRSWYDDTPTPTQPISCNKQIADAFALCECSYYITWIVFFTESSHFSFIVPHLIFFLASIIFNVWLDIWCKCKVTCEEDITEISNNWQVYSNFSLMSLKFTEWNSMFRNSLLTMTVRPSSHIAKRLFQQNQLKKPLKKVVFDDDMKVRILPSFQVTIEAI